MQNNKEIIIDFKETLNSMASLLTHQEIKCIKVSEPLFVYMTYFLKDDVLYEKGDNYPIGYIYGTPIEIDTELQGFDWKPIIKEKGMDK